MRTRFIAEKAQAALNKIIFPHAEMRAANLFPHSAERVYRTLTTGV